MGIENFRQLVGRLLLVSNLGFLICIAMAIALRLQDRLDGPQNFVPWKVRIVLILEENELWDEVVHNTQANPIQVPASIDAQALATFNKRT